MGMISNISRRAASGANPDFAEEESTLHELGTLLTLDTRLQFGGSGGALIDLDGNLIGMTTSLAALEGYEASAGYAIPLDAGFRRVIDSLLAGYEVEYGFLGVALRDVPQEETMAWEQVQQPTAASADQVAVDSPAHRGGLEAGDVILAVNGVTVYGADDVTREVALLGPEAVVALTVYRPAESQILSVEVRLGKWPVHDESGIIATARRWPPWRGLSVDYPTSRRRYLPFDVLLSYRKAVLIHEVAAGSSAERAGLKVGDMIASVDGTPVETPGEFHRLVDNSSDALELELLDGRKVSVPADGPAGN
jgi:serine protease Do